MTEPLSLKVIGEAITTFWGRGAVQLWCLATVCLLLSIALVVGAHFQFGDAPALFAAYGTILPLSALALFVFAAFKTYSERPQPILSLIPNEQQSFWGQSPQQNGQTTTQFCLRFQVTNLSDGAIMLSDIRLCRPLSDAAISSRNICWLSIRTNTHLLTHQATSLWIIKIPTASRIPLMNTHLLTHQATSLWIILLDVWGSPCG